MTEVAPTCTLNGWEPCTSPDDGVDPPRTAKVPPYVPGTVPRFMMRSKNGPVYIPPGISEAGAFAKNGLLFNWNTPLLLKIVPFKKTTVPPVFVNEPPK